ncbi:VOC family protein [Cytobacillus depressus]|uniref:VOC family protein n=1 Tax=Cytobacillus depressus TaxID=1602942 RepID=A0A6L3V9B3_9BACI|nr:VOC family protein [Cytobacillus depressus]
MKIDHLVINVDKFIQEDKELINSIHSIGLPYKPRWGKGTKGFKVSNIWIGKEYFELVRIKAKDGGGWIKDWTTKYLDGHRGLIGFALEVNDIEETYQQLLSQNVNVSPPEPLTFRWFFNLLTKTMPWRNLYLPEFKGVPFQFFLQQLNDEKSKTYMEQYMVPNSRDNAIEGITEVNIYGKLTEGDKKVLYALFEDYEESKDLLKINLGAQTIRFITSNTYRVEVVLKCNNKDYSNKKINIHNLQIQNS